ncbi:membrane protein insertion efficiency factor YidD [Petrachloros mirabilis]
MKTICLTLIAWYRYCISPFLGQACRFEPSCSEYAALAISRFGVLRGVGLSILRLLKCHPFHPGGFDPVEKKDSIFQKVAR